MRATQLLPCALSRCRVVARCSVAESPFSSQWLPRLKWTRCSVKPCRMRSTRCGPSLCRTKSMRVSFTRCHRTSQRCALPVSKPSENKSKVLVRPYGLLLKPICFCSQESEFKHGWLVKRGNRYQSWKRRFFVIQGAVSRTCHHQNPDLGVLALAEIQAIRLCTTTHGWAARCWARSRLSARSSSGSRTRNSGASSLSVRRRLIARVWQTKKRRVLVCTSCATAHDCARLRAASALGTGAYGVVGSVDGARTRECEVVAQ